MNSQSTNICPVTFRVTPAMVERFAALTGDSSSLHMDPEFGRQTVFGSNIVHGMLSFVFVRALRLSKPGTRIRQMSARFARPVFPGDVLYLEGAERGLSDGSVETDCTFSGSDRKPLITGRFVVEGGDLLATALSDGAFSAIPVSRLEEQDIPPNEICKGDEDTIRFRIEPGHIACLRGLLAEGILQGGNEPTAPGNESICPVNLLGALMISPFIGMLIPGKLGLLTTFDVTFDSPLSVGTLYDFVGKVTFKSISAATIVEAFSISESNGGRSVATGKITSKINDVAAAMPSVIQASTL